MIIDKFLAGNREKKLVIHCVGDAMIDQYHEVKVNRISPEFPMPIMKSESENPVRRPGGAANVAYQLRHFNVSPYLISFLDPLGQQVFDSHHINIEGGYDIEEFGCRLPVKHRFSQEGVQIIRWDVETPYCGLGNRLSALVEKEPRPVPRPDVVIFSDYNKGFFSEPQYWLKQYENVITIVDPKTGPIYKWQGCTIFKPNADEAQQLSGLTNRKEQCKYFHKTLNCPCVVITQSGKGVVGSWAGRYFEYTPESPVQVESTIGAGDCFISVLAIAVGHGMSLPEAAEVAFEAGRIYVQQRLNRPIVPAELAKHKIVHAKDLAKRDFKLVLTNGCFDLLHSGHISTLKFAKSKGDKLVVAINSDEGVFKLKGPNRPVNPLEQRMEMLAALEMVDFVVSFDEDTPLEVIEACMPDALVKGSDYELSQIVGAKIVPEVYRAPILPGLSSTKLLNQLREDRDNMPD